MMISTTAPVTDNDLVVCLWLRLLTDDTQQIRLWQCQLGEIFKRRPTVCVISKLNQALLCDLVHLKQTCLYAYNIHRHTEMNTRLQSSWFTRHFSYPAQFRHRMLRNIPRSKFKTRFTKQIVDYYIITTHQATPYTKTRLNKVNTS
jgi:hypothetical protein